MFQQIGTISILKNNKRKEVYVRLRDNVVMEHLFMVQKDNLKLGYNDTSVF